MKKSTISITLAAALLSVAAAQASDFKGGYLGGKIGHNTNTPETNATSNKIYPGVEAGYGWDIDGVMIGVDAFWDDHTKSVTKSDYGADVKLGFPMDKLMPYVKLGMAGSDPGTRVHGGLGIEYKFAPQWSVAGEWTADSKSVNSVTNENSNISVGVNYYFDKPYVAPAKVAAPAPAPVAVPVAAPVPAQVAVPVEAPVVVEQAPKTIFTDKPITIEGASFDTGSAKLKPTAAAQLDVVVDFATKYKDANLTIVGYTDSLGNEIANQQLSTNRAASVKAYLVKKGVDANRIVTSGKGSANPVGDNKTKEGRAQNRRVEINSTEKVAK
jgi:OmpA-OmpF porin, OOP family